MKKVAIVQSNYIPWKGYFDLIAAVDEFVLYDDVQYTRRDWRNRNQIKTPNGLQWLTVPVRVKGRYHQRIKDVELDGTSWMEKHWLALAHNYAKAPHFDATAQWLRPLYDGTETTHLSSLNHAFLMAICANLGIETCIRTSDEFRLAEGKSERLADICAQAEATEYVSGPAARDYLDESVFQDRGIDVSWFNYEGYEAYPQLWGEFVHGVSIVDLLFNCGPDAQAYLRFASRS